MFVFLHRDVHAETKRKLRRMFQRYSTVEEYDASYGEICGYFMEHMWEKKDEVIRESDVETNQGRSHHIEDITTTTHSLLSRRRRTMIIIMT